MDVVLTVYLTLIGFFNCVALINYFSAPRLKKPSNKDLGLIQKQEKLISVIIPMRNEEKNASRIINELLVQDYKNIEIIVVDDGSSDNTWEVLNEFRKYPNFLSYKIKDKPNDWVGKSWALYNGVQLAKGDVLVFIDADVSVKQAGISAIYGEMVRSGAGVVNCFPRQAFESIGETIVAVPLMTWTSVGNLPIAFINQSTSSIIYMSNGQLFMCDRRAYEKIGGHESVKSHLNEDSAITKMFKKNKIKIQVVLGDELVTCRMYDNYREAIKGFGRSFVSSLNNIPSFLLLVSFWLILYLLPYILVFYWVDFIWVIIGILINRLITSIINRENPLINMILHPIQMLVLIEVSAYSLYLKVFKKIVWKDRPISG